jgi:hypothetical protein
VLMRSTTAIPSTRNITKHSCAHSEPGSRLPVRAQRIKAVLMLSTTAIPSTSNITKHSCAHSEPGSRLPVRVQRIKAVLMRSTTAIPSTRNITKHSCAHSEPGSRLPIRVQRIKAVLMRSTALMQSTISSFQTKCHTLHRAEECITKHSCAHSEPGSRLPVRVRRIKAVLRQSTLQLLGCFAKPVPLQVTLILSI